jgi:hypothetical protein
MSHQTGTLANAALTKHQVAAYTYARIVRTSTSCTKYTLHST